jgi:hypothetical protein
VFKKIKIKIKKWRNIKMKKETMMIEYVLKGELSNEPDANDMLITEIVKKDNIEVDKVNLEEMIESIKNFRDVSEGKNIEFKVSFKVVE